VVCAHRAPGRPHHSFRPASGSPQDPTGPKSDRRRAGEEVSRIHRRWVPRGTRARCRRSWISLAVGAADLRAHLACVCGLRRRRLASQRSERRRADVEADRGVPRTDPERARVPEERITHHRGESDHQAFLELPFLEALDRVRVRMTRLESEAWIGASPAKIGVCSATRGHTRTGRS
jgi:hypothetical protein